VTQLQLNGCTGIVLPPDWEDGRGSWCTPKKYADLVGRFDLDPFTNARSHIRSPLACMLERGDDGLAGPDAGQFFCRQNGLMCADADWRVWIQPPYDIVLRALAHYGHTRFTALLRLDTSTVWFQLLFAGITEDDLRNPEQLARLTKALKGIQEVRVCPPLCEVVMVPRGERIEFDPPPGVKPSSNPFPHGFFYKREADVPDALRALCFEWRTA
jgi:hypothetical protein